MLRDVDIKDISDGRLYGSGDMVKADCKDCVGCSECCTGMGESIVMDPYDVWRMTTGLNTSFAELMTTGKIELGVVDGILLPHLCMSKDKDACVFLNDEGRCGIHPFRTGFCRLFPLGRVYDEDGNFKYFLQIHECKKTDRAKIKIEKWMDTPYFKKYEEFIKKWHEITRNLADSLSESGDYELRRTLTMELVKVFFLKPFTDDDFYSQFEERVNLWMKK
ncbi:MAG: YkgJ family cysteine cluster protein [Lachnospiraceae bacterium]|nr:YkgJ family cysteine cluster protein [Lachnospiraceae bacterium]